MILNSVVVGLMWRALLNPDWGLINWLLGGIGYDNPPNWLGDRRSPSGCSSSSTWQWTPFVFIIVFARLQVLPEEIFEAAAVDGAGAWGRLTRITLPCWRRRSSSPGSSKRSTPSDLRSRLRPHLRWSRPTTTTLSFYGFETGFSFTRYGFSSAIAYVMVMIAAVASTMVVGTHSPEDAR